MSEKYRKLVPIGLIIISLVIAAGVIMQFTNNVKQEVKKEIIKDLTQSSPDSIDDQIKKEEEQRNFEKSVKVYEVMDDTYYHIDLNCKNIKDKPIETTLRVVKLEGKLKPCPICLSSGEPKPTTKP